MRRLVVALSMAVGASIAFQMPAQAGGSCRGGSFTDARGSVVRMKDSCFAPTVVRVQPGGSVTWVNDDRDVHALGGVTNVFGQLHSEVPPGAKVTYRFEDEGVFPYLCILHPGMGGAVVVGDGAGEGASPGAIEPVSVDAQRRPAAESSASTPRDDRDIWLVGSGMLLGFATSMFLRRPLKKTTVELGDGATRG